MITAYSYSGLVCNSEDTVPDHWSLMTCSR